jgi:hypothetical protein
MALTHMYGIQTLCMLLKAHMHWKICTALKHMYGIETLYANEHVFGIGTNIQHETHVCH